MEYKPRRKAGQGYDTNYNTRAQFFNGPKGKALKILVSLCLVVVLVGGFIYMNLNRIQLMIKGYSFHEASIILNYEDGTTTDYLEKEDTISFTYWDEITNNQHYYDYDVYASLHQDKEKEDIVTYVDTLFNSKTELENLGYDMSFIRKFMSFYEIEDYTYLVDKKFSYKDTKKFFEINGCIPQDMEQYLKSKKDPLQAVLTVSYKSIDTTKYEDKDYEILDPSNTLVLIKKGYHISSTYEPDDLVNVDILKGGPNTKMRKEAAKQLEKLAADAKKEGLYIGIRSAYRSYQDQQQIYDQYFKEYDEVTASQLVSVPGTSEHQLGISVDLTSKSVIDGKRNVFGDTAEYQWIIKNGHKYGYILRYPDGHQGQTGAMNEPWHFRYVGKEAATIMYEKNWTLEDYILHNGFDYNLIHYTKEKK